MYKRTRDEEEERAAKRHRQATEERLLYVTGPAQNANYGTNYGTFYQHNTTVYSDSTVNIASRLNPILDASHTRNLLHSPPNSECLEGTRVEFIAKVLSWARAGMQDSEDCTHILWVYGYAGCGKSAISLAVAQQLADEGRLAASFFFFRGAGDRSRVIRLFATIVCQMIAAVPSTLALVENAVTRNPGLLSSSTASLSAQFTELVFKPILEVADSLNSGPLTIVLDGVDECEDSNEIGRLIVGMIACFTKHPLAPLRFVVASRVEDHLHQLLHSSNQVRLLDLVDHTSDADIETAVEACFEREKSGGVLKFDKSWPSIDEKWRLVKHIGKSFIFMTTILRELFKPFKSDGRTPMDRLPLLLSTAPNFDELYRSLLTPLERTPHFLDIISTIALAERALSIAEIADLLEIRVVSVAGVLLNLHAIMRVPGDDRSPVTLWHTSFRDFLCSKRRAGPFFAPSTHHQRLAYRSVRIVTSSTSTPPPASKYVKKFGMRHLASFLQTVDGSVASFDALLGNIMPDLVKAVFDHEQTALELACLEPDWKLVRALVNGGADINAQFTNLESRGTMVALHAACYHNAKGMIYFLLDKGADPNIVGPYPVNNGKTEKWTDSAFPLAWAARHGDVVLVRKLLENGANPNLKGGNFGSALHNASVSTRETSSEIVHILLEHGADPNINNDGACRETPLHQACRREGPEITRLLLDHGADPNKRDIRGYTPLHSACINEKSQTVAHLECLLRHNADPNIRDIDGDTPLHYAYSFGNFKAAEYLLSHNADPNIRNNEGRTPLEKAGRSP